MNWNVNWKYKKKGIGSGIGIKKIELNPGLIRLCIIFSIETKYIGLHSDTFYNKKTLAMPPKNLRMNCFFKSICKCRRKT